MPFFAGAKSVIVGPNLTMVSKILVVQPAQIRYIGVEDLSHKAAQKSEFYEEQTGVGALESGSGAANFE